MDDEHKDNNGKHIAADSGLGATIATGSRGSGAAWRIAPYGVRPLDANAMLVVENWYGEASVEEHLWCHGLNVGYLAEYATFPGVRNALKTRAGSGDA